MPSTINLTQVLLSALLGVVFTAVLLAIVLVVLHFCGVRLLWRRRTRSARIKTLSPKKNDARKEEDLPEEELIAILTAAALTALDSTDTGRFRVVAFRRI